MNKKQVKWVTPGAVFMIDSYTNDKDIPYFSLSLRGIKNDIEKNYVDPFLEYVQELEMFGYLKNTSINVFMGSLTKNISIYLDEVINSDPSEINSYKNHRILDTIRRSINRSMLDIDNMYLLHVLEACGIVQKFNGDYYVIEPKHLTREQVEYVKKRIIK